MMLYSKEVIMNKTRLLRLTKSMQAHQVDWIALTPGSSLSYLTNLHFHLMERPVIGFFSSDGITVLVLPDLERKKAEHLQPAVELFSYDETASGRDKCFKDAAASLNLSGKTIGIEALRCRAFELWLLQSVLENNSFQDCTSLLSSIRNVKEPGEIKHMREAVRIAEQSIEALLKQIQPGQTEKEIAAELVIQMLRHGSEPELPFDPIVASGPNSALPHALPTDRKVQQGDLLLIDWGARAAGYISDLTRTFALGEVDSRLRDLYKVVYNANKAGREFARPGVTGEQIDSETTRVLTDAGYTEWVRHRTGHGIGLEAHEAPYISQDQKTPLRIGMAFTIEPGLYIPDFGGVRIEDDVILTENGAESLSTISREWRQL